jgi:2-iminobutanoate/2-iminopropanoate deaminase
LSKNFYLVGEIHPAQQRGRIAAWLGEHRPTTTVVFVAALASPIYKVEIDAWASSAN